MARTSLPYTMCYNADKALCVEKTSKRIPKNERTYISRLAEKQSGMVFHIMVRLKSTGARFQFYRTTYTKGWNIKLAELNESVFSQVNTEVS